MLRNVFKKIHLIPAKLQFYDRNVSRQICRICRVYLGGSEFVSIRIFHFMAIDLFIISLFPCRAGRAADVVIPGFVAVNLGNSQTCNGSKSGQLSDVLCRCTCNGRAFYWVQLTLARLARFFGWCLCPKHIKNLPVYMANNSVS